MLPDGLVLMAHHGTSRLQVRSAPGLCSSRFPPFGSQHILATPLSVLRGAGAECDPSAWASLSSAEATVGSGIAVQVCVIVVCRRCV